MPKRPSAEVAGLEHQRRKEGSQNSFEVVEVLSTCGLLLSKGVAKLGSSKQVFYR